MAAESLPSFVDPEHGSDAAPAAAPDDAHARLRLVADRVAPLALARERTLPVLDARADLFPDGALRRGSTVGVVGVGATSLALAVAAGPSVAGSWTAVVGHRDLGLAAADECGVALERLLVVDPDPSAWAGAVAALVGSVDVVVVAPRHRVRPADDRRLAARLRERGSVVVRLGASRGVDVALRVESTEWDGLGAGHGVLRSRRVTVRSGGRGSAARPRSAELLLPGPAGVPVKGG